MRPEGIEKGICFKIPREKKAEGMERRFVSKYPEKMKVEGI